MRVSLRCEQGGEFRAEASAAPAATSKHRYRKSEVLGNLMSGLPTISLPVDLEIKMEIPGYNQTFWPPQLDGFVLG